MTKLLPVALLAVLAACEAQRVLDNYGATLEQQQGDSLFTPEQLAETASRLEPCGFPAAPPTWPMRRVAVLRTSLRLPPDFRVIDEMQEKGSEFWVGADEASYMFSPSNGGTTYFLAPGEGHRPIEQRTCRAHLFGYTAVWSLITWAGPKDSSFMAMTTAFADRQTPFQAALLSKTRATRDAMVRSLMSLEARK